jgi:hypothetical protein
VWQQRICLLYKVRLGKGENGSLPVQHRWIGQTAFSRMGKPVLMAEVWILAIRNRSYTNKARAIGG